MRECARDRADLYTLAMVSPMIGFGSRLLYRYGKDNSLDAVGGEERLGKCLRRSVRRARRFYKLPEANHAGGPGGETECQYPSGGQYSAPNHRLSTT